ncbi:hypothetical protein ACI4BE_27355, partial [Klebsiella pneumoniae]|uniref:hypothetical protein n=1 Tax=Klebsiella pneumoniae TaxID=573 RepID=UPI00385237A9
GIDPKSETFNEEFRSKAIEILASSGYHVDPSTFNLSDVSVTENGDITASVTTRFSKSFKADGSAAPTEAGASGNGIGLISTQEVESPTPDVPATIMTASAIKARKARREALVREAQMAPP